ncbi:MAG: aldo/keto reductase, partial [Candidatus Eremiobacteraeota bacterium]|nr:aldo/keto reductase [Candidatus Eremiobacteraeota bacterium]
MKYRALGASGLKVSAIGLGSWLTYGGTVDKDATRACVLRAWERGINFLDTANVYSGGAAEAVLGGIVGELNRAELVLASKLYFPIGEGANERGLSRKHVRDQIDRSLARLKVDYLDLYQCHRYDVTTPLEETCRAMD